MFGIGGSELVIIAIIALIFLGPDKLPEATKKISRGIRELKKGSRTLQATIENDEHIGGAIRDLRSAMRGEEPAPRKRKKRKRIIPAEATEKPNRIEGDSPVEAAGAADGDPPEPKVVEAIAAKKPAVRLPPTAGEVDPDDVDDDDDAELAAMIRPASGTVSKATAKAASKPEPKPEPVAESKPEAS